ncbi:hypothetical protein ACL7TT_10520 [Microbulbifer sp. 2304DJ12-6]|uniref:hypothetical protein n=1 Tax=Microbulbifer sp. 2304DJ12-6 TaxID=3233340 RepID=UPI0039AF86AF
MVCEIGALEKPVQLSVPLASQGAHQPLPVSCVRFVWSAISAGAFGKTRGADQSDQWVVFPVALLSGCKEVSFMVAEVYPGAAAGGQSTAQSPRVGQFRSEVPLREFLVSGEAGSLLSRFS